MRLVCLLLCCAMPLAAADIACPWLSSATAEGILNSAVITTFTPSAKIKDDGLCEFKNQRDTLRIEVITMQDVPKEFAAFLVRCGNKPFHLRGIGNDAVICSSNDTQAEVVSRIRDRALLVSALSNAKATGKKQLQDWAQTTAEQAAGSLF